MAKLTSSPIFLGSFSPVVLFGISQLAFTPVLNGGVLKSSPLSVSVSELEEASKNLRKSSPLRIRVPGVHLDATLFTEADEATGKMEARFEAEASCSEFDEARFEAGPSRSEFDEARFEAEPSRSEFDEARFEAEPSRSESDESTITTGTSFDIAFAVDKVQKLNFHTCLLKYYIYFGPARVKIDARAQARILSIRGSYFININTSLFVRECGLRKCIEEFVRHR